MRINRVQFQPGLSMPEFFERYGSEAKCWAALHKASTFCGGLPYSLQRELHLVSLTRRPRRRAAPSGERALRLAEAHRQSGWSMRRPGSLHPLSVHARMPKC